MTTSPALRVEYLSPIKRYQVFKYENGTGDVVTYAHSALDLIARVLSFLQRDPHTSYQLTYSEKAWHSLTGQERKVLEGIIELHMQAVDQAKNNPYIY